MTKIVQKKFRELTLNDANTSKDADMKFNCSMKNLLVNHDDTIEDKIATVKIAQMVDKERFGIALQTLMRR